MPDDATLVQEQRAAAVIGWLVGLLPGLILCIAVALSCLGLEQLQRRAFGHSYVEALVLAILLGMTIRSFWIPSEYWRVGIAFSAKQMLEAAVVLLGASMSFVPIAACGMALVGAIVLTVAVTLCAGFIISRLLGLKARLSLLIACGNAICGNSAIAAVAPVIGADSDDIASSISFTAIFGVMMVLGLPLLISLLALSATQYGILAGLTVYAVPQVLAATVPAGLVSAQIGTLVKLIRVLMLGPVVVVLGFFAPRWLGMTAVEDRAKRTACFGFVPWFIVGFALLAALRSLAIAPVELAQPIANLTSLLTIIAMAALGLGVDVRVVAKVGGRVTAAVALSLLFLLALGIAIVRLFA